MRSAMRVLALTAIGAAAFVPAAHAQDMTTVTLQRHHPLGRRRLSVFDAFPTSSSLPRARPTTSSAAVASTYHQKNSDFSEYGGGAPAAASRPRLAIWGGWRVTGGVKGFCPTWRTATTTADLAATADCCLSSISGGACGFGTPISLVSQTSRDVDYWGGQLEFKFGRPASRVQTKPNFYRNDYFIAGADVRGIDQDIKIVNHADNFDGRPDLHLQGDARYHLLRRLYRLRRRVQLRLHPRREECRRPLRSPRTAHLHQRAGRPLFRPDRL